ncbi:hypothetical protein B0189_07315 [Moraxella cuniculi]|nr:hypothetical protein B0189_07315 [Moraxella cuniculi]
MPVLNRCLRKLFKKKIQHTKLLCKKDKHFGISLVSIIVLRCFIAGIEAISPRRLDNFLIILLGVLFLFIMDFILSII